MYVYILILYIYIYIHFAASSESKAFQTSFLCRSASHIRVPHGMGLPQGAASHGAAEAEMSRADFGVLELDFKARHAELGLLFPIYGSVSKPCTPVVHIKIAGKWMSIPLKMVLISIDPYPYGKIKHVPNHQPGLIYFATFRDPMCH